MQFVGWYDTALGADCAFDLMVGGGMRCIPVDVGVLLWLDDTCSSPVIGSLRDPSCAAPAYWVLPVPPDPCLPRVAFEVGRVGPSRGVASVYYGDVYSCHSYVDELPTFEQDSLLYAEDFVAAEVVEVERPGGVIARVAMAADGAQQVLELVNHDGDVCEPVDFLDGAGWRCVVAAAIKPDVFDDRDCTVPAPPIFDRCGLPEVLVAADGHVYLRGAPGLTNVFKRDGEACRSLGTYEVWQNGARAAASAFPTLAVAELGAGAVRTRFTTDARGNVLMPAGLFDPATGTACRPTAEDGAADTAPWRCLPIDVPPATTLEAFTDRTCTIPAGPLLASHTYGAPRLAVVADVVCDNRHPAPLRRLVDVRVHGDPVYQMAGSACLEVDYESIGYPYDVVAELPLATLPALTMRVE
ncbi:MAG: hypothetical protein JNK64_41190 [Myxococcales bacterium]|nr:hypothetical protein [Myxococcales bacterium]